MARKFLATILAGALAITGFTAPARASDNDALVKFLAGATALVIIGKAIENSNKSKATVSRHDNNRWDNRHDNKRWDNRHDGRRDGRDHRAGRHDRDDRWGRNDRDQRRGISMPSACRTDVQTRNGTVRGYGYRCVQQHPRIARNMPGQCLTQVRTHGHTRFVYTSHCLARNGFRV
ncbi:hypothetical protein ATO6_04045 [Oceanicola sp. 22II-s10i]|uniref:hypothetical protein n=1 Tax=Oceanicola sp. 22II-s10i TaxID=1317116 RepID=UPI000B5227C1|nr:hypothetical protein [Oceanicola sp. 22II-s10i]OWU86048.1 hypothetical protein ATO6_04045 [Oceanicola sp. 22II-s10i]